MIPPPKPQIWPFVWQLLRRDARLYVLSAVLQTARLGFTMLPGLIVREIFNNLSGAHPAGWNIWTLCALLIGAALTRGAVLLWAIFVENTGLMRATNRLREQGLAQLLTRPASPALRLASGDLLNRLGADTRAIGDELRALLLLFGISVSALIALAIMVSIAPVLALVASVPVILATFLFQAARSQLERLRAESRAADSAVSAFLADAFGAVQTIQVAGTESQITERLRQLSERRRKAALAERIFNDVVIIACTHTVAQIGSGLVLLLAGAELRAGSFTVGDFALFVTLLESVADFAFYLGMHMAVYRQAGVSLGRLQPLLEQPQSNNGALSHLEPLQSLKVCNLTLRYPNGRGIEGVNLTLQAGTITIITGRVGSGKTTLLKVVLGLSRRDTGSIVWNEQPLDPDSAMLKPPYAAYTAQATQLFSLSIRENIVLGRPVTKENLEATLKCVDLLPDLASFADGLETQVGTAGLRLSGGQAQRVATARMLVRDAELLVMDDVSSALDVHTEQHLWGQLDQMRKSNRKLTILVVSHRPELLRRADQVICLEEGRVVDG